MDKMIISPNGEVVITNDGATILKSLEVAHPCAKMLVDLSAAQDVEAGDGTTTVTVIAGAILGAAQKLLQKGIHPTVISESFMKAADKAEEILQSCGTPIDLADEKSLLDISNTSLSSKVVSQYSDVLSPIAVKAVMRVIDPTSSTNVNLSSDIKVVKKLGGTVEDTELVDGLVFTSKVAHTAGGPTRVQNAKIGLIQFQLSPPKTNMESQMVVTDYTQMDRILREERNYLAGLCKTIQKSGCNVLLVQKSILRDAVTDMSLHFLAKMKILVVTDIERDDIEFISKTLGCTPVANPSGMTADKLGTAGLVEEVSTGNGKIVKITGVPTGSKTVTILVRGSNKLVLDEADRSLHDALCVIRCLVKKRFVIAGGAAPEVELSLQLGKWAKTLYGLDSVCVAAYAEAFDAVPYTLAENAGLHPIDIVTELRRRHAAGEKSAGINVRKGCITNILEEKVIQPLLVSTSAVRLATETVSMVLKIDDIVPVR